MFTRRLLQVLALTVLAAAVPGTARSQDAFDRAKTLYLEAAYEDALALLDTPGPPGTADVHLYRALCLLALGRASEADAAIARSIEADPTATAARPDVSPRVAAMLADARRRMLPDIARRRVADGRLAYQQGDRLGATQRFEAAVRLLDDPSVANQSELTDLKTLASGFLDLLRAQSPPPAVAPPAAVATVTPAPASAPAPGAGAALPPAAERAPQPAAAAAPAPAGATAGRRRVAAEAGVPAHAAVAPARPVVEKP
jgi:tetratricopeptide (TPR) repeat protein